MNRAQRLAVLVFLGIPFLCCLGGMLVIMTSSRAAEARLNAGLAEARKAGMPVDAADIEAQRTVDPNDDAAPIYRSAIDLLNADRTLRKSLEDYEKGKGKGEGTGKVMAMVALAASRPECRFPRNWNKGATLLFPELADLKGFAKAFAQRADDESKSGDWQAALRDLKFARRIGEHAEGDPILIGMLVRIASESIVEHRLWEIAKRHSKNAAFLDAALAFEESAKGLPSQKHIFGTEYALARITVNQLGSVSVADLTGEQETQPSDSAMRNLLGSPLVRNQLQERLLRVYLNTYRKLPDDPNDLDSAEKALTDMDRTVESDTSFLNTMNRIMLPVYGQATNAVRRMPELRRLSQLELRLFQIRNRTGAFPPVLPDFGELGIDPFTSKPFVYRRTTNGFVLYSVGPDKRDDGGIVKSTGSNRDDVVQYP